MGCPSLKLSTGSWPDLHRARTSAFSCSRWGPVLSWATALAGEAPAGRAGWRRAGQGSRMERGCSCGVLVSKGRRWEVGGFQRCRQTSKSRKCRRASSPVFFVLPPATHPGSAAASPSRPAWSRSGVQHRTPRLWRWRPACTAPGTLLGSVCWSSKYTFQVPGTLTAAGGGPAPSERWPASP